MKEQGDCAAPLQPFRLADRACLVYDVQREGSVLKSELPFVVGVLADFQGHSAREPLKERSFLAVDRDHLNETMKHWDVRLRLWGPFTVPALGYEPSLEIRSLDLRFVSLEDFEPASIARQIALSTNGPIQSQHRLETLVAQVLEHPDFLKLESTWRGLHYLVNHVRSHPQLQIKILNLSKTELAFELDCMPEVEQSRIYRRIVDEASGSDAAFPFAVLIGDYQFTHDPTDVTMLTELAELAESICCPVVAAASPTIFGMRDWSELHQVRELTTQTVSTAHSAWNSFRDRDDARYVVLTGPRILGRPPYSMAPESQSGKEFDERTLDPDSHQAAMNSRVCWMNTAFVLGACLCNAFVRYGLCVQLTANVDSEAWGFHTLDFEHWQDEARIEGLPRYTKPSSEGHSVTLGPLEVPMTGRRERELHQCGVLTLCGNKLATAFHSIPTCHRPKRYDVNEASLVVAFESRLDHVLVCSRFAHYLRAIYRNLGGNFETLAVRDHLESWLVGYVNACGPVDSKTLARYPLCAAHLEVRDDPVRRGGTEALLALNSWLFQNPSKQLYRTLVRLD